MRTNAIDYGYVAGLELHRHFRGAQANVELRYTHGRSDLAHKYQCCTLKSRSVSVLVGYELPLLK